MPGKKIKIIRCVSRDLTREERLQFKHLVMELDESIYDSVPKQQMLVDYIRARQELERMRPGYDQVMKLASYYPEDEKHVANLNRWMQMTSKIEVKIDRLRDKCGLTAKYESQLNKAIKAKGAPQGGHEYQPWRI